MQTATANQWVAVHALSSTTLTVELPDGRTYRVMPGHIFLSSTSVAHQAALKKLCRAIDPTSTVDMAAPVSGDKQLFERHRGHIFRLPYDGARLAIRIELFKEPAPSIIINAFERPAPSPPAPITGFEFPN